MDIKEFQASDKQRWDDFVESNEHATFFHRAGWRNVIQSSFGHTCPYLYAESGGEIVGVLPLVEVKSLLFGHALISNGYSVCGGPAAISEDVCAALTSKAIEIFNETGASYIEYRSSNRLEEGWATQDSLYAGFSRPIEAEEDACLKQIPRKQRAVLRKALKGQLSVHFQDTVDDLYQLYALSVRNLGTPVFTKKYFRNLFDEFGDDCRVLTVSSEDGTPLSSVLNFYFKDAVLPFYTGAAPLARRVGASDLQYWHTMRDAVAHGYTVFDFGRSKVGTGPYSFKKNWGFTPEPLSHQYYLKSGRDLPNVNPTNPKYRLFIEVWKRLPLPIANLIGPVVSRGIG